MEAIKKFIKYLNDNCKLLDTECYKLNTRGRKYLKVIEVRGGKDGSVYCFIKKDDGGIYKADSWTTPSKGERANVNNLDSYVGIADEFGGWLYRYK